jgi:hypothetical protein
MATFNCYFPFYEEVVLRRLISAGCTYNILMVDATRCAEAFSSAETRPRRAGRDYTLIPVNVGGAFHPKVLLRLGKSKGTLLVGSHNVTLAGFGLNDEITNVFRLDAASAKIKGGPLRSALEFLRSFVPIALPEVAEAFEGLKLGVPWIEGPLWTGRPDRVFLASHQRSPELWSQVAACLPREVSTAFVCGAFFDPKLTFLQRLLRDVHPRKLVVGIDPASVEIDPAAVAMVPGARWVNVAGVAAIAQRRKAASHYFHAKVLWFSGEDGELLVSGSANPSVAAFLAPPHRRNVEAVVADSRAGAGFEIGLEALIGAPPITDSDWDVVAERRAAAPALVGEPHKHAVMAIPVAHGFSAHESLPAGAVFRGIGDDSVLLGEAKVRDESPILMNAPDVVRDGARYLEAVHSGEHLVVLVHRPEEIPANLGGDTRKALRQALGALGEDPSQLETLLKLTEKVIFDSDDVVRVTPLCASVTDEAPSESEAGQSSLALEAAGRRVRKRRRSLASGDILVLLEALMRRLGEGLPESSHGRVQTDETEIGADDEDGGELARAAPDYEVLAKACRSKVRRLVKRMKGQFELAAAPNQARRGIVQLAAVLRVTQTLRIVGQRLEWRRKNLELVDSEDERRLFQAAVLAVAWGNEGLATRAITESGGEVFEELSIAAGLLGWLAWELGLNVEEASKCSGLQGVEDEAWYPAQLLATLSTWIIDDEDAIKIFEESVRRTPRFGIDAERWLSVHCGLLQGFARTARDPDPRARLGRHARPGDLVVLGPQEFPRVRVLLDVRPGSEGTKAVFFDPATPRRERAFLCSRIRSLPWPSAPSAVAAIA